MAVLYFLARLLESLGCSSLRRAQLQEKNDQRIVLRLLGCKVGRGGRVLQGFGSDFRIVGMIRALFFILTGIIVFMVYIMGLPMNPGINEGVMLCEDLPCLKK